jgi:hypothetical protein
VGFFIANPVEVSIHGVGLSLVNNAESVRRELAYLTLSSSDIVWEVRKEGTQRYKARESYDGNFFFAYEQYLAS